MAAQPGEERLLTVFADVHYYFSPPSPRPLSHRFDKGSYLYVHGNRNKSGARLEIANYVGKPEQDAFTGLLDTSIIRQSHKHPTLCTIIVDGFNGHESPASSPSHRPEYHWKLPTADPRSERNLPLHLHTLDIYFWTAQDATSFISLAQSLLQASQLELLDFPLTPAPHEQLMSPVVQQLETVVIEDSTYHGGQSPGSGRSPATQKQHPGSDIGQDANIAAKSTPENSNAFAPLAYNPAAPAAPEPIAHREKTPPPVDGAGGTGLASAAAADKMQSVSPPSSLSRPGFGVPTASSGYIGAPPTSPFGGGYVGSPPSAPGSGNPSHTSFAPPPAQSPRSQASPSNQQLTRLNSPKQQPPLDSPAAEILGDAYVGGHHQPLQHVQPQYPDYLASGHQAEAPEGGFSDFKYTSTAQQQQQQPPQASEYDIHSQVYRPTEEEFNKKKPGKSGNAGGQSTATGKLEERAGKVDKKVNRFFKKLETRIG